MRALPRPSRHPATSLRLETLEDRTAPAVFTVTNTNDTGAGSFRQAVLNANALAGPDTIRFDIGTGGAQTITPLSALPAVTGPTRIDATTQPGLAGTPLITLRGVQAGAGAHGLNLRSGASAVRGFIITEFNGAGIRIAADNCSVLACAANSNRDGVALVAGAAG